MSLSRWGRTVGLVAGLVALSGCGVGQDSSSGGQAADPVSPEAATGASTASAAGSTVSRTSTTSPLTTSASTALSSSATKKTATAEAPYSKPTTFWQPFRSPVIWIHSRYDFSTQLDVADTIVVGRIVAVRPVEARHSQNVHAEIESSTGETVTITLRAGVWSDQVQKFLPTDQAVFILSSEGVNAPDTHSCIHQPACIVLFSDDNVSVPLADRDERKTLSTPRTAEDYAADLRARIAERSTMTPATS